MATVVVRGLCEVARLAEDKRKSYCRFFDLDTEAVLEVSVPQAVDEKYKLVPVLWTFQGFRHVKGINSDGKSYCF